MRAERDPVTRHMRFLRDVAACFQVGPNVYITAISGDSEAFRLHLTFIQ